ncbi:hypothetical protein NC651_034131 [Populus alba x Populus x berolinensis]|nr:hypothetical protein NC651_034131 [Populus alba x Populus x berolinensis]
MPQCACSDDIISKNKSKTDAAHEQAETIYLSITNKQDKTFSNHTSKSWHVSPSNINYNILTS